MNDDRRRLGSTDIFLSRIGIGTWAMGGPAGPFHWGSANEQQSEETILEGLENGLNWIDTAPGYGFGHAEEIIGKITSKLSNPPFILTKCSIRWTADGKIFHSLKADSIRDELQASMRRLRVDVIDVYQIHWPIPDERIEEAWETLVDFKEHGLVRAIGISNFSVDQMTRLWPLGTIDSLQSQYSILDRSVEETILPFCAARGISFLAYSPLASGLLSSSFNRDRLRRLPVDDWRACDPEFTEPRLSTNLKMVARLQELADRRRLSVEHLAVAWVLRNPSVTGAIVGFRNRANVLKLSRARHLDLEPSELGEIDSAVDYRSILRPLRPRFPPDE